MLLILTLLACQKGDKNDDDTLTADQASSDVVADADTDADSDSDSDADSDTDTLVVDSVTTDSGPLPTGLTGTPPASPVPLLSGFVAISRHGDNKGPTDLVGTPTVMWFYPAAATGG